MFHKSLYRKVLSTLRSITRVRIFVLLLVCVSLISIVVVRPRFSLSHLTCECDEKAQSSKRSKQELLIVIMSSPTKAATRQVLRETWLSRKEEHVKHLFVLGTGKLNHDVLEEIQRENATQGDLLILENFEESYEGLAEKVLLTFHRVDKEFSFNFLLKCDDDTFVDILKLLDSLSQKPRERLYWGYFKGGGQVKRAGKWREAEWFLCDTYLPYAYGGGYVLSNDLVAFIARNYPLLQRYKNEDVSVGVWLAPLKVDRVHDVSFDTGYKSRGCFNDYLVTHKQSPRMLREKHENLSRTGQLCREEKREGFSYTYNWTVPASQCCRDFVNKNFP